MNAPLKSAQKRCPVGACHFASHTRRDAVGEGFFGVRFVFCLVPTLADWKGCCAPKAAFLIFT